MKQPTFNGKKHPVFWPWRKLGAGQSFWFQAAADCAGTHNCNWTHQPPPKQKCMGKRWYSCVYRPKKTQQSQTWPYEVCKWLGGDLFYGSFTGPKCFFRHGNTPEARPGPCVTFRVSSISIKPRSVHADELHELHERRPDPHFWKTTFAVLAKLNLSVLDQVTKSIPVYLVWRTNWSDGGLAKDL